MRARHYIIAGAVYGLLGVALGAFGRHGLPGWLEMLGHGEEFTRRSALFGTAARYQMYHAPMLVLVGMLLQSQASRLLRAAGSCYLAGVLIFSGLLYAMTFLPRSFDLLGAIVPIGGTLMLLGWALLAAGAVKIQEPADR